MPVLEWKDEMIGDLPDLVETEWDVELSRRLDDVTSGHVELVDHAASMCEARARLAENPNLFPQKRNGVHKCLLPLVFPYSIYYIERPEDIVILAYAHQKRRPGYWRSRRKTI